MTSANLPPELTAARLQALHQQGFVVLPGVLDAQQIAALRAAIDRLTPQHWDYSGLVDHYKCVFNRDPFWLAYLDQPGVIELAEAALGADCHIIGQTAWRSHPGFVGAELHLDYLVMELPEALLADPAFELPMQICTAHFYLDDIDPDLCPTRVIPGSHRGRTPVAGRAGAGAAVPRRRCADVSQRAVACRQPQPHDGSHALPAAGALRPAHGRAKILALPELAFRSRGAGRLHATPAPAAGRA
jgi:hypothetical protein